jgi:hypothetical protein
MKVRSGFVSNSSSSSFVIVTTKAAHENAISQMTKWQQEVIGKLMFPRTLAGIEIYIGGEYSDAGSSGTLDWLNEEMGEDDELKPEDFDDDDSWGNEAWTVHGTWEKYQDLLGEDNHVGTSIGDNG